jgi:hypothetical protein
MNEVREQVERLSAGLRAVLRTQLRERLPDELKRLVERALSSYTGVGDSIEVDKTERRRLLDYIESQLPQ